MTKTTERLTDNELDMALDWAKENPIAMRALLLGRAAVIPHYEIFAGMREYAADFRLDILPERSARL